MVTMIIHNLIGIVIVVEVVSTMDPEDEDKLKCDAAYKVMRKKFPQLHQVLATNDIPDFLYAEELIEDETMEKYGSNNYTTKEKGRSFHRDIYSRVKLDYSVFEKMIEIIKEHGVRQEKLIQSLEGSTCL